MRRTHGYPLIRVGEQTIPYTSQTKILRVTFDNKLTFQNHITERKNIATYTLNRLQRFRLLNPKLQLELFNTLSFSQYAFSPNTFTIPLGLRTQNRTNFTK